MRRAKRFGEKTKKERMPILFTIYLTKEIDSISYGQVVSSTVYIIYTSTITYRDATTAIRRGVPI